MSKIAWLGMGLMGVPMSRNLLKAGHQVACYNRTKSKAEPVIEAGGQAFDTPREAAHGAEFIISTVTDGPDVEAVLFGPDGALSGGEAGALCIDMSTISPLLTRDIAARAQEAGFRYLDAPLTGGTIGAQNATLSIMVGGDKADFEAARPLFEAMGKTITHCGEIGAGQSVKVCNQICGALNLLGVCEALTLSRQLGVDPEIAMNVINGGAASNWAMQNLAPKILKGDFAPGFMIDTQQKDMKLVQEAADKSGVPVLGASLAQQLWRAAQANGQGEEGIQGMWKVLQRLANAE